MAKSLLQAVMILSLLVSAAPPLRSQDNDVTNEWRITAFPHYPIKGKLAGFGYLGWVKNPGSDYSLYYLGVPGVTYTPRRWVQVWGGRFDIYTNNDTPANGKQDTLELRPFIGGKFFLPNKLRWNIFNFSRLEFRQTYHHDTHEWTNVERLRMRFGIEAPLTSRERAWKVTRSGQLKRRASHPFGKQRA